jgi:hypothetical protein
MGAVLPAACNGIVLTVLLPALWMCCVPRVCVAAQNGLWDTTKTEKLSQRTEERDAKKRAADAHNAKANAHNRRVSARQRAVDAEREANEREFAKAAAENMANIDPNARDIDEL